jgi:hypothetical protein
LEKDESGLRMEATDCNNSSIYFEAGISGAEANWTGVLSSSVSQSRYGSYDTLHTFNNKHFKIVFVEVDFGVKCVWLRAPHGRALAVEFRFPFLSVCPSVYLLSLITMKLSACLSLPHQLTNLINSLINSLIHPLIHPLSI